MCDVLIEAAELADALASEAAPALLDCRWALGGPPGREAYRRGHIGGARFVDLDTELAAPAGSAGRHPLPAAADFQLSMRRHGVSMTAAVVVYDQRTSMAAARAWWLLRYFGHPDVRVLNGGFDAWLAAGFPVDLAEPSTLPGDFVARPGGMPLLNADQAASLARTGVLFDARAPERFRGEVEPVDPVAGHIPGARNLPASHLVDEAGRFIDPAILARQLDSGGAEIGAYCGSGVTASHLVLAAAVAGARVSLYPGSWSEWVSDPTRPVELGG